MAVTATHLTTNSDITDSTTYNTASITPSANKLILALFTWTQTSPGTATASGNGLTWVEIASRTDGTVVKSTLFRAMGASPSAGAVTFTITGGTGTPDRGAWSVNEFGNVDTTGSNGANAIVQSAVNGTTGTNSLTVTLAAFGSVDNATYGATGETDQTVTPGTGFSELAESASADGLVVQTQWRNDNDTSVDWTYSGNVGGANGIAVEIKFVAATTTSTSTSTSTTSTSSSTSTTSTSSSTSSSTTITVTSTSSSTTSTSTSSSTSTTSTSSSTSSSSSTSTTSTSTSSSTSTTSTSTSTSTTSTSTSTSSSTSTTSTSTSSSTSTSTTSTSTSSSTSTSTTSTSTSSSTSTTTSTSSSSSTSTSTSTTTTWIYPFIVDSGLASQQAEMSFTVDVGV